MNAKPIFWAGALVAMMVVSLLFLVLAVRFREHDTAKIAELARDNCAAIEHLKSYAYQSAIRAQKTLPTIAYYKEHPDELRVALLQFEDQIKFFAPKPC